MTTTKRHYRSCNICEAMCGLVIEHDGARVLSVRADPNDPLSRGHICPKAVALQDFRTDPDRVTRPLLKRGRDFEEIGWDDAFALAGERIRAVQERHGQDGMALYFGNPNSHKFANMLTLPRLAKALGTRNRYSAATADQMPHHVASIHMMGHPMMIPVPDLDRTHHLLILGGNPIVSNGSMMTAPDFPNRMAGIMARGKVVVIDPRRTETAEKASEHHFIRPETDALLLLALIHEVFAAGAVRLGPLEDLIDGVDALVEAVEPFTPEFAAGPTGIAAEEIRRMAREFREAPSAVAYARMGASTQSFGGLCQWATNALNIVTGNFDAEGGAMFTTPALDYVGMTGRKGRAPGPQRFSRVSGLPSYIGEFPVATLAEEIETPGEGQIRGLVTVCGNPALTAPNGRRLAAALDGLEFMCSIDIHVNDTTRHADLILPGTVALEEPLYDVVFHSMAVRNTAGFAEALFDRPDGMPPEWEVIARLAAAVSGANEIGPDPLDTVAAALPQGLGGLTLDRLRAHDGAVDLGPLTPSLRGRLYTPEERLNIAPQVFLDDLRRLRESAAEAAPFMLVGRRQPRAHNSWTQNAPRLVKGRNRCTLEIHPEDAAALGVEDDGEVEIRSRVGAARIRVEITDRVARGVVAMPQGWGQSAATLGAATRNRTVSINDLTDERRVDPVTGNAAFNGTPVTVAAL